MSMSGDWRDWLSAGFPVGPLFSSRGWGIILWIGLGIVTVALLVLTRTRWGQAKPLSKCIVLSLLVHLLFLGYAYSTRLVFDYPRVVREESVQLTMLAPDDESSTERPQKLPDSWREEFVTASEEPPVPAAERQRETLTVPEAESRGEMPVSPSLPQLPAALEVEPQRETAPAPPTPAAPPLQAAPSELAIDAPRADRQELPSSPQPEQGLLERVGPVELPDSSLTPTAASLPPDPLLPSASKLQRLSDIDLRADRADATLGAADQTSAADNRDAREGAEIPRKPLGAPADVAKLLATVPLVRRLGDSAPLPELFKLRHAPDRGKFAERLGGNPDTEAAVQAALAWLAANQQRDGRWDASQHGAGTEQQVLGHDRQHAGADADTGITGLAVLAFLGAGHTHFEGTYRKNVQHALEYLTQSQHANGSLAGQSRLFAQMYCHGIATLAISEAYAMTGDYRLQPTVERAVQFTVSAQHAGSGGWRYQPGDPGDTSQLGWQLMALRSAELAGISIPERTYLNAKRFLQSVTSGERGGLAAYRPGEAPSRSMTAEALLCRLFLGERNSSVVQEGLQFVLQEPPQDGQANLYYWYYATMTLFQVQGPEWQTWNAALQQQLLRRQRTDGQYAGSWDTNTVWGGYGGRVYTTAIAAMCLEVYYRYLPILANAAEAPPAKQTP